MAKEVKKETTHSTHDNSCGIVAVTLGILSIVFASVYGILLGIPALVFAMKQHQNHPNKWSKWGKILSIIGLILSIITIIVTTYYFATISQFAGLQ